MNEEGVEEIVFYLDTWVTDRSGPNGEQETAVLLYDTDLGTMPKRPTTLADLIGFLSQSNAERIALVLNMDYGEERLRVAERVADSRFTFLTAAMHSRVTPWEPTAPWPWYFVNEGAEALGNYATSGILSASSARNASHAALFDLHQVLTRRIAAQTSGEQLPYLLDTNGVSKSFSLSGAGSVSAKLRLIGQLLVDREIDRDTFEEAAQAVIASGEQPWTAELRDEVFLYGRGEASPTALIEKLQ
jgi:hypothetical protein